MIDDRSALEQGLTGPSAHLAALPIAAPKWVPNRRGRTRHDSPTLSRFCPQEGGTVEAVRIAFPSLLGGLSIIVGTTCNLYLLAIALCRELGYSLTAPCRLVDASIFPGDGQADQTSRILTGAESITRKIYERRNTNASWTRCDIETHGRRDAV